MASRLEYLIDVLKSEQGLTELEIPEKVEEQEVLCYIGLFKMSALQHQ